MKFKEIVFWYMNMTPADRLEALWTGSLAWSAVIDRLHPNSALDHRVLFAVSRCCASSSLCDKDSADFAGHIFQVNFSNPEPTQVDAVRASLRRLHEAGVILEIRRPGDTTLRTIHPNAPRVYDFDLLEADAVEWLDNPEMSAEWKESYHPTDLGNLPYV